jgi:hypothetical protein
MIAPAKCSTLIHGLLSSPIADLAPVTRNEINQHQLAIIPDNPPNNRAPKV